MAIGTAIGILGVGTQISGGIMGNRAARKGAARSREIGRLNEEDAINQAVDAVDRGKELESLRQFQNARLVGAQIAGQAAAGLNSDFGSAALIRDETEYFAELDAATIRDNVDREVEGFIHASKIARLGGQTQARAQESQGLGQLISSAANAASSTASLFR